MGYSLRRASGGPWEGNPDYVDIHAPNGHEIGGIWRTSSGQIAYSRRSQKLGSGDTFCLPIDKIPFPVGTPAEVLIDWLIEVCGIPETEFGIATVEG